MTWDSPDIAWDSPWWSWEGEWLGPVGEEAIECWVTAPDGTYLAHLEHGVETAPFRGLSFQMELSGTGSGRLEAGRPNATLDAVPGLLALDNLVWMRYRSKTFAWVIEETASEMAGEDAVWTAVSGRGTLQLLGDRIVWPDGFSEDDLDPSVWSGPGTLATVTTRDADEGDRTLVVAAVDGDRLREGQRVTVTTGADSDTGHIRRMRMRDDGDWSLKLRDPLEHDHPAGATVVRHGPAFTSTTLTAAASAGARRLHVETARRLHPGQRVLVEQLVGPVGEWAIVREVDHARAKPADSATLAAAASSGQRVLVVTGRHFSEGQTVTVGADTRTIEDRSDLTGPVRSRLRLDSALSGSHAEGATVTRAAVDESWTITLRRPLVNAYAEGDSVTRPSDQWHTVVGMAAGEMLWELVEDSNARSTTQIARGIIETDPEDADQWTQRLAWDSVLDVVQAVTDAHGDVEMGGLTLHYRLSQGTDRSGTVWLEEGADLLRASRDESTRDAVTWVVAKGVGEGVRAKLAVAKDDTATRRREAFLDASDATSLAALEAAAEAALVASGPTDAVGIEVAETRHLAFVDWGLGDRVWVHAPSRDIDEAVRIVAITVAEVDDGVRVSVDVMSRRTEALLELERGNRRAAATLGIHGRQPQGQLVPFTFSGSGVFDEDEALEVMFHLPDRAFLVAEATCRIQLRRFWATARSAASGGGSTSGSGGASTPTSSSGGATTETSEDEGSHTHTWGNWVSDTPGGYATRRYAASAGPTYVDIPTSSNANLETTPGTIHHHDVDIPAHTHTVTIGGHTHTTPAHTHDIVYGTYAEALPSGWEVEVLVDRLDGETWENVWEGDPVEDPARFADIDLSTVITEPGSWRIRVRSASGQPQGGRLAADVWGVVLAGLESV